MLHYILNISGCSDSSHIRITEPENVVKKKAKMFYELEKTFANVFVIHFLHFFIFNSAVHCTFIFFKTLALQQLPLAVIQQDIPSFPSDLPHSFFLSPVKHGSHIVSQNYPLRQTHNL